MADLRSQLQQSLSGSYTIERELGGGGMSRVFLADEHQLGRKVVVKLLSPELAEGMSVDRFAREIRLAAALQDPHIVPVLAAGTTTDGLPYYTMPFVEGRSLRDRLTDGQVPLDDAVRILRDMGEALEYAHAHGVVHRDIKPENVLLAGRTAVVADFGIAKAINAAKSGVDRPEGSRPRDLSTSALTQLGQSLGTPAYLAPEQATGDPTDHRADLYSWGVVAYELLAGAHPFAHKASAQQLIAAHVTEQPKPLNDVRPGIPAPLGALVMRCLAKVPAERPASATEVLAELSAVSSGGNTTHRGNTIAPHGRSRSRVFAIAGGIAVVLAIALGAMVMRRNGAAAANADARPSLAVLPFEHQGDSADAYLTDGITDEIRGKLTGVHDLIVIARASSNAYRVTKKSPREIAEELGVRYLLTGTVRVVGTGDARRVLVRPELVEITKATQPQSRWQQPVDVPATDVIQLQRDIAQRVVGAMEVAVTSDDRAKLTKVPTRDAVAYDLYLRGRAAIGRGAAADPASQRAAIALFEQSIARDSTMVDAWVALVGAQSVLYANGTRTAKLAQEARTALDRAVALDPSGAAGHRAKQAYYRLVVGDPVRGLAEAQEAHRLEPGEAVNAANVALSLLDVGRFDEAVQVAGEAARLDPRNGGIIGVHGRALWLVGRIPEARNALAQAAALTLSLTFVNLRAQVELTAGDVPAARRVLASAMNDIPRARLLAYAGTYGLSWLLDAEGQQDLLALSADDYGGDHATWALVRARMAWWSGDSLARRRWGDTAVRDLRTQLADVPNDVAILADLAEALAHAGHPVEAMVEAKRLVDIARVSAATRTIPLVPLMNATLAASTAAAPDVGVPWLIELQSISRIYTSARLRVDPQFNGFRGDPRFERLAQAR